MTSCPAEVWISGRDDLEIDRDLRALHNPLHGWSRNKGVGVQNVRIGVSDTQRAWGLKRRKGSWLDVESFKIPLESTSKLP